MKPRPSTAIAAPIVATALGLAACGGGAVQPFAQESESSVDCSDQSLLQVEWIEHCEQEANQANDDDDAPEKSSRGYIPVAWGERNWYDNPDGSTAISIWFEDFELDPTCAVAYTDPRPKYEHFLAIKIRVETTEDFEPDSVDMPGQSNFKVFALDGTAQSDPGTFSAYRCLDDAELLPGQSLTPASKYEGSIVLDVDSEHGYLIYEPFLVGPGMDGFELEY